MRSLGMNWYMVVGSMVSEKLEYKIKNLELLE